MERLQSLGDRGTLATGYGSANVDELYQSAKLYCQEVMKRLNKEDEELLPLLGRTLSDDDWFSIAVNLMSSDAKSRRGSADANVQRVPRRERKLDATRMQPSSSSRRLPSLPQANIAHLNAYRSMTLPSRVS